MSDTEFHEGDIVRHRASKRLAIVIEVEMIRPSPFGSLERNGCYRVMPDFSTSDAGIRVDECEIEAIPNSS